MLPFYRLGKWLCSRAKPLILEPVRCLSGCLSAHSPIGLSAGMELFSSALFNPVATNHRWLSERWRCGFCIKELSAFYFIVN